MISTDFNKVFEALPNVQTIWVTKDEKFHLHPHYGGEQINRDELKPIESIESHLGNDEPIEPDQVEQPEPIDAEPIQSEPLNEPRQKRAYNKRK